MKLNVFDKAINFDFNGKVQMRMQAVTSEDLTNRRIRLYFDVARDSESLRNAESSSNGVEVSDRKLGAAEQIASSLRSSLDGWQERAADLLHIQNKPMQFSDLLVDTSDGAARAVITITVAKDKDYDETRLEIIRNLVDRRGVQAFGEGGVVNRATVGISSVVVEDKEDTSTAWRDEASQPKDPSATLGIK